MTRVQVTALSIFCTLATGWAATECGTYLLGQGATPAQDTYAAIKADGILAKYAAVAKYSVDKDLEQREAKLAVLESQANALGKHCTYLDLLTNFFSPKENATQYLDARNKAKSAREQLIFVKNQIQNQQKSALAAMNQALGDEAIKILKQSLMDPPPKWAQNLKVTSVQVIEPKSAELNPKVVKALVAVSGSVKRGKRLLTRPYPVYLELHRDGDIRAGVMFEKDKRDANMFFYDDFKTGSLLSPINTERVAHTSLDVQLEKLQFLSLEARARATLAQRMSENAILRRQVQQVLGAAIKIRERNPGRAFAVVNRDLLRSYLTYWTNAQGLESKNMVASAVMISAFSTSNQMQKQFIQALDEATLASRTSTFVLSDVLSRMKEAQRRQPDRIRSSYSGGGTASSSSSSDDSLFWIYYWERELSSNAHHHNPTYIGPDQPGFGTMTDATGSPMFDDPGFIQHETFSNPTDTAVDTYTNDQGQTVDMNSDTGTDAHTGGDTHAGDGGDGGAHGGDGGGGDGGGDGGGGDGGGGDGS